MTIFLSYGHDERAEDALRIKAELEARGHTVWFDLERLRSGRDWERYIEEGIEACDRVVLLMTPHSVRRRDRKSPDSDDGFCLNEIAKAIERGKLIVPVMLVWVEQGPPVSICRIQYLDLTDCVPLEPDSPRHRVKLDRLYEAIEHDKLDFEGGQARLQRVLRPLKFDEEMARHLHRFTGREWISTRIDTWVREETDSRLFWLAGGPGLGKSAFSTHLVASRDDVVACHFCVHGHDDKGDPARALLSIAYQVAQRFPEYARRLQALSLEEEASRNLLTLFDNLLVGPLSADGFPAPDRPLLVVLDALDEATRAGRNDLAEFVASAWGRLPAWLRLFVTSRPEPEVFERMRGLRPHLLVAGDESENLEDLRAFVQAEFTAQGRAISPSMLDALIDRSEGMFLYAVVVVPDLLGGALPLDDPGALPRGLTGYYRDWFSRRFPDVAEYRREVRPILECACAQREPLPLALLARATGASLFETRERLRRCGSLFPVRPSGREAAAWTVVPFHKSLPDWLAGADEVTGDLTAGEYSLDIQSGAGRLARTCLSEWLEAGAGCSAYALWHVVAHLLEAGALEDARGILTDFDYLMARCATNETGGLVLDFGRALAKMPKDARSSLDLWEAFFRERAHLLARGSAAWPANRILLQLSWEHADESPITEAAEAFSRQGKVLWSWLRNRKRPRTLARDACLRTLEGHQGFVFAVAVTPDGRRVVSGGADDTLMVWDMETGICLRTIGGHTSSVTALSLMHLGRLVVSASVDRTLKIHDIFSGACLLTLVGHRDPVTAVSVSPNGYWAVSGSEDGTLKIWDLKSGACIRTLEVGYVVYAVSVTPDGRQVVSGDGDGTLKVWDQMTGSCVRTIEGHDDFINSVTVTSDGRKAVSGSEDGALKVWDLVSGECLLTIENHGRSVNAISVTPDDRWVLSGSDDGALMVWDLESGKCLRTLHGHSDKVVALSVSPDGRRIVSGDADGMLRVWDLEIGGLTRTDPDHPGGVRAVCVTGHDQEVVSGGDDATLKIWDPRGGRCLRTLEDPFGYGVVAMSMTPDGRRAVSVGGNKYEKVTLVFWDLESGDCTHVSDAHASDIAAVAVTPNGQKALSVGINSELRVWNLDHCACLEAHAVAWEPSVLAVSLDGRRVLLGDTIGLWLFDMETWTLLWRRTDVHEGGVSAVSPVAANHQVVSGGSDGTMKVWGLEEGECRRTIEGHGGAIRSVSVTPDGRFALSGSADKTVRFWDLGDGECLGVYILDSSVHSVAVGSEGFAFAALGSGAVLYLEEVPSTGSPGNES